MLGDPVFAGVYQKHIIFIYLYSNPLFPKSYNVYERIYPSTPYSCFSYHFCFLVFVVLFVLMMSVLSLTAVINPSFLFLM